MESSFKILLIDDDDIVNFLNRSLLEKLTVGVEIIVMRNGVDALQFLNETLKETKECPQLILLDINMPIIDGFEFLAEFKRLVFKNQDDIRIVTLTTSNNPRDIEKMKGYDIMNYINKPLSEKNIQQILESHPLYDNKNSSS